MNDYQANMHFFWAVMTVLVGTVLFLMYQGVVLYTAFVTKKVWIASGADPEHLATMTDVVERVETMHRIVERRIAQVCKAAPEHSPGDTYGPPGWVSTDFNTGDADLDLLLGLVEDMNVGICNMDTGLWFMDVLERIQGRLGVSDEVLDETLANMRSVESI